MDVSWRLTREHEYVAGCVISKTVRFHAALSVQTPAAPAAGARSPPQRRRARRSRTSRARAPAQRPRGLGQNRRSRPSACGAWLGMICKPLGGGRGAGSRPRRACFAVCSSLSVSVGCAEESRRASTSTTMQSQARIIRTMIAAGTGIDEGPKGRSHVPPLDHTRAPAAANHMCRTVQRSLESVSTDEQLTPQWVRALAHRSKGLHKVASTLYSKLVVVACVRASSRCKVQSAQSVSNPRSCN